MNPSKSILLLGFLIAQITSVFAREVDTLEFNSKILGQKLKVCILKPIQTKKETTSVVYLLHGAWGNYAQWLNAGQLQQILSGEMKDSLLKSTFIVMPEAFMSYYMNSQNDSFRYENFFFEELMPWVESRYNCGQDKKKRIISGLSMGGHGAMLYALKHPELFQSVYAFSPALRTPKEMENLPAEDYRLRYGNKFAFNPKGRINDHYFSNDVIQLSRKASLEALKSVNWLVDIGDNDYLIQGNLLWMLEMKERGVPMELRIRQGVHNWPYWQDCLRLYLKEMDKEFKQL